MVPLPDLLRVQENLYVVPCEQVRRCCNFYEDCLNAGGTEQERGYGRSILKDFSNDAQIKSLQSDGYNVYMYLDDELIEVPPCPCAEYIQGCL